MAGTYLSTTAEGGVVPNIGKNLYEDYGAFTDDGTTANVVAKFPMNSIIYATAYRTDAGNKCLECDTDTANQVTFKSPESGKKYRCHVVGKM